MTRQRNDKYSTEFGLWTRGQLEGQTNVDIIDSDNGYIATDLDYIWANYKKKGFMLIEEKRYKSKMSYSQNNLFKMIDTIIKTFQRFVYLYLGYVYKGFHLITFENTNPDDGKIYINNTEVTTEELIDFLAFKSSPEKYIGYFEVNSIAN